MTDRMKMYNVMSCKEAPGLLDIYLFMALNNVVYLSSFSYLHLSFLLSLPSSPHSHSPFSVLLHTSTPPQSPSPPLPHFLLHFPPSPPSLTIPYPLPPPPPFPLAYLTLPFALHSPHVNFPSSSLSLPQVVHNPSSSRCWRRDLRRKEQPTQVILPGRQGCGLFLLWHLVQDAGVFWVVDDAKGGDGGPGAGIGAGVGAGDGAGSGRRAGVGTGIGA